MATNYYVNNLGQIYSGAAPTGSSHSTKVNVSAFAMLVITSTPTDERIINDQVQQLSIASGAKDGVIVKLH